MRESVKNKRKWTTATIAIAIVLLLSLTIGLLVSSVGGNIDGPLGGVSEVADVSWSGSKIGDTDNPTTSGESISTVAQLRTFLKDGTGVGYLTQDIYDFKWDTSTTLSNATFKGVLDGNGHTVELTNDLRTWNNGGEVQNGSDGTICSGLFVAVNQGTIKNIKLTFKGHVQADTGGAGNGGNQIWAAGIVCGENSGTIDNLSLLTSGYVDGSGVTQRSYVGFHFTAGAGTKAQQKIIVGGVCGKQNGTLTRIYVDYKNIQLESDAKNSNHITGFPVYGASLHMSTVGGVYGAYTGADAASKTKNLMVKADGATQLQVANQFKGTGANNYLYKTVGAVAGVCINGVEGVVWDFRGSFNIKDSTTCNEDGAFIGSGYTGAECAAAYSGKPTGFYSPISKYPMLNGATEAKQYTGNIFSKSSKNLPTTDNYPHYERGDAALEMRDTSGRIVTNDYAASRLGEIDLYFTSTPNELVIEKTIDTPSDSNDITQYDVFWRAGYVGEADDTNFNMEKNKSFSNKLMLNENRNYEVVSGKKFGQLKNLSGSQTYTGQDFMQLYAQEALSEYRRDLSEHLGIADLTLDRSKCKFLIGGNDSERLTSLIYPQIVGNVVIKTIQSSDTYKGYSYVDVDKRFVCAETTLTSLAMLPADLTPRANQPYVPVSYNTGWDKEKEVTIRVLPSATFAANTVVITSGGAVIDRIEYRRVGTEAYTSVDVNYVNTAAGHQGATFKIAETTPKDGAEFEMIAYHNNIAVAFAYHTMGDNAGTMSGPFKLGLMKIDSVAPTIDISNTGYLDERWFNQEQTVKIPVADANSGISTNGGVRVFKKICDRSGFSEFWAMIGTSYYTFDGNEISFNFNEHALYYIEITDQAGNSISSAEFEVKVDTAKPEIESVSYYYMDGSTKKTYNYATNGRISQTIFAEVKVNLGHSGGMLAFYAKGDEAGDVSTAGNVVQHTTEGIYTAAIQKAGTPQEANPDIFDPVNYVFYVTSVATDNNNENPKVSDLKEDTAQVSVGQIVLTITIDKLDISSLTKVYDGTADFKGTVNVLGEYPLLGQNANNINDLVTISGRFIKSYEGTGQYWEDVKDANTKLVLIIEMYAKTGYNFAIANNQAQNNIYPFLIGQEDVTYTVAGKEVTNVQEIGIFKKEIKTLKVQDAVKTYWDANPKFEVNVGADDLVAGDTLADLDINFETLATKESDAGVYYVSASILDSCKNYYYNTANVGSVDNRGELRIMRAEIKSIIFEGELNSITCFEIPNIRAYFMNVQNRKQYFEIRYKNQDREEFEFIPGKRTPLGTYFYIVLLDDDTLKNYANVGDPNRLIGRFEVVGDIVKEGISYTIRDLDPSTPEIEVEFVNHTIDFRSLLNIKDTALSAKMKIYYTASEIETPTINEIGTTYVTLKVPRGDNRYQAFTKEYVVKVIKANVDSSNDDLIAPTEKVEAGQEPINGVYFTNKAVNLTTDNISEGLYNRLDALLTEDERTNGGVYANYKFNFSYLRGAKDVAPENVKNQGEYTVNLVISGKKINSIQLQTTLNILTRELSVVFDFDKYQGIEGITYNKADRSISKVFSGLEEDDALVLSLDKEFEAELNALFGVTEDTAIESLPYGFSANGFIEAMAKRTITFDYKFGQSNSNVRFVNNDLTVEVTQFIIDLSVADVNEVYSGVKEIYLSEADIAELIRNGVTDPYSTGSDGLYFGTDIYPNSGIEVIRIKPNNEDPSDIVTGGKIGLRIPNSGSYKIAIRMATANNNFRIGNGFINIEISKAPVSSVSYVAEYFKNGKWVNEDLVAGKGVSVEYSGNIIKVVLSEAGKAELDKLGVAYEGDDSQITIEIAKQNGYRYDPINEADFKNAGSYRVSISITNDNILSDPFTIDVVINKKQLDEYVGMFNPDVWYINGNLPTEEQEENGMMYTRDDAGIEAVYSMKLIDEKELLAAGFEIVYKYNGIVANGVTKAGSNTVTAEISYPADPENWEVKVVQLWKLDSNGKFVYNNQVVEKDKDGKAVDPNENVIINKVKQVVTMDIQKADLQIEIDALGKAAILADQTYEYDGTEKGLDFTKEQYELFKQNGLLVVLGKHDYIAANEYAIVATFFKLEADGVTKDTNYDSTEMEATLTISPKIVEVFFEYNIKADSKGNLVYGEGDDIQIRAYYFDKYGRKIIIKSLVIERVKGEGDEIEFSSLETEKDEKGKDKAVIKPGRYQVTVTIADTNYAYNEDLQTNFLQFKVKNETGARNTTLYILLAVFIVFAIAVVLVAVYMKRMYNPAVQEVDIDD